MMRDMTEVRRLLETFCRECDDYPCLSKKWCQHETKIRLGDDCPQGDFRTSIKEGDKMNHANATPTITKIVFSRAIHLTNLIYHVCPLKANDAWRSNVRQLVRRWGVFSGRKIIAVAIGEGCHGLAEVQAEFRKPDIEWMSCDNDPELREAATFLPLLESIQSTNELEATFYGHTKGNSTKDNALGAEFWRNQMYRSLLDDVHAVRHNLLQHPAVGTTIMFWQDQKPPYPSKLQHGNWMFAGTFFWFRHDRVFGHANWRDIPRDRYGAESWLSGMFDVHEVCTLFQPWPVDQHPAPSPYDPRLYQHPIRD